MSTMNISYRSRRRHQSIMPNEQKSELRWWRRWSSCSERIKIRNPMLEIKSRQWSRTPGEECYRRQYVSSSVSARWSMVMRSMTWSMVTRIRVLFSPWWPFFRLTWVVLTAVADQNRFLSNSMSTCTICGTHVDVVSVVGTFAHCEPFDHEDTHAGRWSVRVWTCADRSGGESVSLL